MTKHQKSHPSPERRSQPFGRSEWNVISVAILVAAGAALLARGGWCAHSRSSGWR